MAALGFTLAGLLALGWLLITARALFGDRSRGQRRCPRCFYEMDPAIGLSCSECGHTARSAADLGRTRRHWRTALLASLLLLAPALAVGALGRWHQQGGWPAVPAPILTRLLWTGSEEAHTDAIRRIRRGEVQHADARRIVAHAAGQFGRPWGDREGAMALLDALARNSYVLTADRPGTPRPMLEELHPERLVPFLLEMAEGNDLVQATEALDLLSHLRDAYERANFGILRGLASSDPAIAAAAQQAFSRGWRESETVRRLPPPPSNNTPHQGPITNAARVQAAFGSRVHAFGDDRAGLLAWLSDLSRDGFAAGRPEGTEGLESLWRSLGLWLYCRLSGFSADAWSAVKTALHDGDPLTRQTAVQQIAGFAWSGDVEETLRSLIREDSEVMTHHVISVGSRFGPAARSLIPDVLSHLQQSRPSGGSSSLVRDFRAMGGEDAEFLEAMLVILQRLVDASVAEAAQPWGGEIARRRIVNMPMDLWLESTWLADLKLRDERGADLVKQLMEQRPHASLATAYAVLSGDRTGATRFLLELKPDLTQPLIVGTPQQTVHTLIRGGHADLDLIREYFVDTDDPSRRLGFANLVNTFIPGHQLGPFEPMLRRLASDEDSVVATAAENALKKMSR